MKRGMTAAAASACLLMLVLAAAARRGSVSGPPRERGVAPPERAGEPGRPAGSAWPEEAPETTPFASGEGPRRALPEFPREAVERLLDALRNGDPEALRKAHADLVAALRPGPVPDEENAALLYREAFEKLVKGTEEEEEALLALGDDVPLSPVQEALVRGYLEKNREALDLARRAADRTGCDFGVDFEVGLSADLSHVEPLIRLSKLLHAEAAVSDEGERPAIARAALRAAEAVAEEPLLISQLVRNVCHGLAADSYARVLDGSAEPEFLQAMFGRLDPKALRSGLVRGLIGELVVGTQLLVSGEGLERLGETGLRPLDHPAAPHDVFHYAQTIAEAAALAERPYYLSKEPLRVLWETRVEAAPPYAELSRHLLPAFVRAAECQATAEARLGLSRVGTALALHRSAHGGYPASLGALGVGVPLDPFTGRPYGYRREGTGFVLYSMGPSGADHGGFSDNTFLVLRLAR